MLAAALWPKVIRRYEFGQSNSELASMLVAVAAVLAAALMLFWLLLWMLLWMLHWILGLLMLLLANSKSTHEVRFEHDLESVDLSLMSGSGVHSGSVVLSRLWSKCQTASSGDRSAPALQPACQCS